MDTISFDQATATQQDAPGNSRKNASEGSPNLQGVEVRRHEDGLTRKRLFGLDFVSADSVSDVVDVILDDVATGRRTSQLPIVSTPNVDIMVFLDSADDGPARQAFTEARYCLPDGAPIVGASKLMGRDLAGRLPGSALFAELWPRLIDDGSRALVVCSRDQVGQRLAETYDNMEFHCPPFFQYPDQAGLDAVVEECIEMARIKRPDYVFLGIGNPKDPAIAHQLVSQWPDELGAPPLVLCLGASFEMYVGFRKRAPEWIQSIGMEWFYRFVQEPRRLFKRYFVTDLQFLPLLFREWWRLRSERLNLGR